MQLRCGDAFGAASPSTHIAGIPTIPSLPIASRSAPSFPSSCSAASIASFTALCIASSASPTRSRTAGCSSRASAAPLRCAASNASARRSCMRTSRTCPIDRRIPTFRRQIASPWLPSEARNFCSTTAALRTSLPSSQGDPEGAAPYWKLQKARSRRKRRRRRRQWQLRQL